MGVESVPNRTRHLADILFYGVSYYFQMSGGCLLPWEEGEEVRPRILRVRSRVYRELWVPDFAWVVG